MGGKGPLNSVLIVVFVAIVAIIFRAYQNDKCLPAKLMLFTGFGKLTQDLWIQCLEIDKGVRYDHPHIPEIEAKDYTFETLRHATDNFRKPAVVRGMFLGTKASRMWKTADRLNERIGKHIVAAVANGGLRSTHKERISWPMSRILNEVYSNPESSVYAFFPIKSRSHVHNVTKEEHAALEEDVNEVVREDLELDRILWPGFGDKKKHKTYVGAQIIIGQGSNDSDKTTGSGWHCAIGNNWFVQVLGRKRWYFLDPIHGKYLIPLKNGLVTFQTTHFGFHKLVDHIPLQYVDLTEGDMLYNPDFYWHTVKNYEGLAIGVPLREFNVSLAFNSNYHFFGIAMLNKLLERFGIDLGGYGEELVLKKELF